MFSPTRARLMLVAAITSAALLAACGGASGSATGTGSGSAPANSIAPDVAAASAGAATPPPGSTLTVTDPKEGATVPAGNVTVSYDITGLTLGTNYQMAVLLDVDATPYLQQFKPVPTNDDHIVLTADKTVTFKNVAAGNHTVTAVLTTAANHLSVSPPKFYKVTFQAQ
jgi:plastocyanin